MNPQYNIYSILDVQLIHTFGQFADGYLFVYLVENFFQPRRGETVPRKQSVLMTCVFAAALFIADKVSRNQYAVYYIMFLILPLLYSCLFFQGSLLSKVIICSIFTSLVLSFESGVIQFPGFDSVTPDNHYALFLFLFSIRRIGIKVVLYFLIRHLFLWQRDENISLPLPCWLVILAVSAGDNIMLAVLHLPTKLSGTYEQIATLTFLALIPVALLLIVKYLSLAMNRARINTAQMAEARVQNQYLQQQLEMAESLRKFRHDYKAHLFAMDTLLTNKQYDELHQYLMSLHQYQYDGTHLKQFTEDPSLNILLNQKATVAEKYGITFDADVYLTGDGKVSIRDLTSLLVNLCDNAIESCATLENASISLSIRKTKAYLFIDITNSTSHNVLRDNPKFRTSKSNPQYHGMGLKIIRSIVSRYNGTYEVSATDNTFTTAIMLVDEDTGSK